MAAMNSYDQNMREEFGRVHDHFHLIGQDNRRLYLPIREMRIRISLQNTFFETIARVCAAKTAGCHITVSAPPEYTSPALALVHECAAQWAGEIVFVRESDNELAASVRASGTERIRYAAPYLL